MPAQAAASVLLCPQNIDVPEYMAELTAEKF